MLMGSVVRALFFVIVGLLLGLRAINKPHANKKSEDVCVCLWVDVCVYVFIKKKLGSKKWERIEDRKNR